MPRSKRNRERKPKSGAPAPTSGYKAPTSKGLENHLFSHGSPQSAATFIHVNVALSRWVALQPWKIAGVGSKAMIDMGWLELVEPARPKKKYPKTNTNGTTEEVMMDDDEYL